MSTSAVLAKTSMLCICLVSMATCRHLSTPETETASSCLTQGQCQMTAETVLIRGVTYCCEGDQFLHIEVVHQDGTIEGWAMSSFSEPMVLNSDPWQEIRKVISTDHPGGHDNDMGDDSYSRDDDYTDGGDDDDDDDVGGDDGGDGDDEVVTELWLETGITDDHEWPYRVWLRNLDDRGETPTRSQGRKPGQKRHSLSPYHVINKREIPQAQNRPTGTFTGQRSISREVKDVISQVKDGSQTKKAVTQTSTEVFGAKIQRMVGEIKEDIGRTAGHVSHSAGELFRDAMQVKTDPRIQKLKSMAGQISTVWKTAEGKVEDMAGQIGGANRPEWSPDNGSIDSSSSEEEKKEKARARGGVRSTTEGGPGKKDNLFGKPILSGETWQEEIESRKLPAGKSNANKNENSDRAYQRPLTDAVKTVEKSPNQLQKQTLGLSAAQLSESKEIFKSDRAVFSKTVTPKSTVATPTAGTSQYPDMTISCRCTKTSAVEEGGFLSIGERVFRLMRALASKLRASAVFM